VVRVVIAEDSALLRAGLVALLQDGGIDVVAELADATGLTEAVEEHDPDVVVLDVRMPPTHTAEGLEAAIALRERRNDIGVLVLSQYVEPVYAVRLLEGGDGGVGYLLKERVATGEAFVDAVTRTAGGESVIDPEVVGRLIGRSRVDNPLDDLSPRELDVLKLMAEGAQNAMICDALFLAPKTVEHHVTSIFTKLGLTEVEGNRRVLAVLEFLKGR
jgi:DNA-binding NarL/FixJ family response regulator